MPMIANGWGLYYFRIFNETIEGFEMSTVAERQRLAFAATGVPVAR